MVLRLDTCYICNDDSIKKFITKISSVQLVNKFIKIKLEILSFDFVVIAQQVPFCIADRYVDPFKGFFGRFCI